MATINQLYHNIKTLIHENFEYKEEEDLNLPEQIHSLFEYNNGEIKVYPIEIADFSNWTGTQPIYSDFILPNNHEIIVTFKNTPNIQVACSDLSDNWIYAQNIGFSNSKTFSYRNSSGGVVTKTPSFSLNTNSIYRITCYNNIVKFYVDNILIHSQVTYDVNNITRLIRIYNDASNVESLVINQYTPYTTYLTENDIIRTWTEYTDVSGRTIYKTPLFLDSYEDIILECKFKSITNTSSLQSVLGIDLYNGNSYSTRCAILAMNTNQIVSYYSSSSSYRNKQGSTETLSTGSVYKLKLTNGNYAYWYRDDVLFASYSIERSTQSNLRLDIFDDMNTHLEYLKITKGV